MRVQAALLWVCAAAAGAVAAPPTVTLPAEVPGEVSAFVVVRATVTGEAKGVKYKPVDPGLSVFPSELLADKNVTVVVASKPGRYRVLAWSGNADGPSDAAETVVVIGGAKPTPPPPVEPPPTDPPPPVTGKLYFAVVRPNGPVTPELAAALRLPAWDEVRRAGHLVKDFQESELPAGIDRPSSLPALVTLKANADGKTWTPAPGSKPVPTTDAQIKELLK
jgi:hypothetical protein